VSFWGRAEIRRNIRGAAEGAVPLVLWRHWQMAGTKTEVFTSDTPIPVEIDEHSGGCSNTLV